MGGSESFGHVLSRKMTGAQRRRHRVGGGHSESLTDGEIVFHGYVVFIVGIQGFNHPSYDSAFDGYSVNLRYGFARCEFYGYGRAQIDSYSGPYGAGTERIQRGYRPEETGNMTRGEG